VKSIAGLLVLLLTGTFAAPVTCAGWEASAASRLECCKRAHHASCHEQSAADNCCAGHEQGRAGTLTVAACIAEAPAAALVTPAFDVSAFERPTAVFYRAAVTDRLHGPPELRPLALRI